ncbi:adenylate/guanylate cyclase domain-containing protein [Paraferrimonas sedimenticola]|uniref:Adenylate cyclase n=1 Tax=Paraferrimonas sedimenticola TaxID=375674 RepID=A0AA37RXZ5_9GAMM|nr:adenylate/guanylate cyclase domain-containing protein [Paraferrimonas sedimenticola]GLP97208.1 adenylate cyclase [Paraferrimonas sedimenticola]
MRSLQQFKRLAILVVAWTMAMSLYVSFRYSQSLTLPQWAVGESDLYTLTVFMGVIFGCLHWLSNLISEVTFIRRMPYTFIVLFKGVFLLIGATTIAYVSQLLTMWALSNHVVSLRQMLTMQIVYSPSFQGLILYLVFVRLGIAFVEQMTLLMGRRMLLNIGLGKYHRPRYENRVFLFVDMVASTAHAESLGDYRFSRLIQDSFEVLSDVAARHDAEIYRFMGDAALISWTIEDGAQEQRCLRLYFDFMQQLNWQRAGFEKYYGFLPRFKAAAHCGQVVVAVVGVNKQEISYFSDVLNTLARLQDQCTPLGQNMLISGELKSQLYETNDLHYEEMGPIMLKGKQNPIEVYGVETRYASSASKA